MALRAFPFIQTIQLSLNTMKTKALFTIQGNPAISATRLAGGWIIQLPYGAAARPATAEEAALIDAAWDGDVDVDGNDWHPLTIAGLA